MRTAAARERKPTDVSRVAAGKKFGRYKPAQEKAVRRVDVKDDEALRKLKEAWGAFKYDSVSDMLTHYGEVRDSLEAIDLTCSSGDVERISLALAEFQDGEWFVQKAGLFLSALINTGEDDDYIIHTAHLSEPIEFLGYRNTKNIKVKGDVGYLVWYEMESGTIIIEGNAGRFVGSNMLGGNIKVKGNAGDFVGNGMEGGTIIVDGDCDNDVGYWMEGGVIVVRGDAGDDVVHAMKGGIIYLEGDYESISDKIYGGKIFHKGKLIVDK